MSESLYFIALVPHKEVSDQVTALKQEVSDKFNSHHAFNAPPHITMHMPFRWKDKRKAELEVAMKSMQSFEPFKVRLNDFDFFEPRVIYVGVEENEPLRELQKQVGDICRKELKLLNANYKDKVFRPHMTIGFRDLKKPQFYQAQEYYSDRKFNTEFEVSEVSLLKHNGKSWEVMASCIP